MNGAIPLKRFFRNGTSRIDGEFSSLTLEALFHGVSTSRVRHLANSAGLLKSRHFAEVS
jgi:hypothetical protein